MLFYCQLFTHSSGSQRFHRIRYICSELEFSHLILFIQYSDAVATKLNEKDKSNDYRMWQEKERRWRYLYLAHTHIYTKGTCDTIYFRNENDTRRNLVSLIKLAYALSPHRFSGSCTLSCCRPNQLIFVRTKYSQMELTYIPLRRNHFGSAFIGLCCVCCAQEFGAAPS